MNQSEYLSRFEPGSPEFSGHSRLSEPVFARLDPPSKELGLALIEFLDRSDVVFADGVCLGDDLVCDSPYEFAELAAGRYSRVSSDACWRVAQWRALRTQISEWDVLAWRESFLAHSSVRDVT